MRAEIRAVVFALFLDGDYTHCEVRDLSPILEGGTVLLGKEGQLFVYYFEVDRIPGSDIPGEVGGNTLPGQDIGRGKAFAFQEPLMHLM